MKHIVKRHGRKQIFDERKVYASVYSASLNAHHSEEKAEEMAEKVTEEIKDFIQDREEVTSNEIRKKVEFHLKNIDDDVALLYSTFMDLC